MATRAFIKIEGHKTGLYKHWDGYPEATLPWLTEFHSEFKTKRGDDPDYCLAQLIRSSALKAEKFNLDKSTETGWGVRDEVPSDVEFVYTLCRNGEITITEQ